MNIKLLLCTILIGTLLCCPNNAQEQKYSDRDYQLIYPYYPETAMLRYGKASSISVKNYKWNDGKTTESTASYTCQIIYQWELDGIFLKEITKVDGLDDFVIENFISKDGKTFDSIFIKKEGTCYYRDNSIKEKDSRQWLIKHKYIYDIEEIEDMEEMIYMRYINTCINTLSVHYSENKMNIQKKSFDGDISIRNVFYNEKGNIIKESYDDEYGKEHRPVYIFEYGPNGFKNKVTIITSSNFLKPIDRYTIEHKFDKKGNWIEQTWYDADGNVKELTERTIVYK